MVARPPVRVAIAAMRVEDIPAVHAIERASFPVPWPSYAFRQELETNRLARYLVVRATGEVVAYGGLWLMVDEAHVTTFAVLPAWRRQGVGARLMLALLDLAAELGAAVATLEVAISNLDARRLYERFGVRPVGVRPRYYSHNGEDALIMTTEELDSRGMRARLATLREEVDAAVPLEAPPADSRDG
ncbi:MAG: ribosomal protein S18-alanine N-acetyltransferase [Candidatus Limnocylindrales bacterium]